MEDIDVFVFDLSRTLCLSPNPEQKRKQKLEYLTNLLPKLSQILEPLQLPVESISPEELYNAMCATEIQYNEKDALDEQPFHVILLKAIQTCLGDKRDILDFRDAMVPVMDTSSDPAILDFTGYELYKDTLTVLTRLKCLGKKLVILHNCNHYERAYALLEHLQIHNLFDLIMISGDLGQQKPSERLVMAIQDHFNVPFERIMMLGDDVARDLIPAKNRGMRRIYVTTLAKNIDRNSEIINTEPELFENAICNLTQLEPYLKYINCRGRLKVGYIFTKYLKRWQVGQAGQCIDSDKIRFKSLEIYANLEVQGPFHCIVHKAHEIYHDDNPRKHEAIEKFKAYERDHPEIKVIDHTGVIDITMDRMGFQNSMQPHDGKEVNGSIVRFPKTITRHIDSTTAREIAEELNFPMFVKTNEGDATVISHWLTVAMNLAGLEDAFETYKGYQVIFQESIDHNATLYKSYILGDSITYRKQSSSRNLITESGDFAISDDFISFDSWKPWPEELRSDGSLNEYDIPIPTMKGICEFIGDVIGSRMFGIDVLKATNGDLYVVDMNYYSSYLGEFPMTPDFDSQKDFDRHILNLNGKSMD